MSDGLHHPDCPAMASRGEFCACHLLDEINELRAENERLRTALSRIIAGHSTTTEMRAEAAEALGPWEYSHERT